MSTTYSLARRMDDIDLAELEDTARGLYDSLMGQRFAIVVTVYRIWPDPAFLASKSGSEVTH